MDIEEIYCPECNHPIHITRTAEHRDGQANLPESAELVCMDFGSGCTRGRCPVTGIPGIVMGVRLVRSHLPGVSVRTVTAPCSGCGEVAELEVVDDTYAVCSMCGTTNRWVLMDVDERTRFALTLGEEG